MAILNITTYNNFQHYLFWDVLQGVSKIYLVKKSIQKRTSQLEQLPKEDRKEEEEGSREEKGDHFEEEFRLRMELEIEANQDGTHDIMALKDVANREKRLRKKIEK